ncbi:MAG: glycosyltransferase [Candidatus Aenigmatarchaeota archaeon]
MRYPKVSVIIPAYNEEDVIEDCLKSVTSLDYPKKKLEIILIDDGSTDKTVEKAKKFKIKIIKGPHKGVGVARNLGIKKSKGELILFVDADQRVERKLLKKMLPVILNPFVVGLDPQERVMNKNKFWAKMHFLRSNLGTYQYDFAFLRLFKKKIIKEIGIINPKYGYYDDWEFTYRAYKKYNKKGQIIRYRNAIVYHKYPENIGQMWRQNKWAGKSIIYLFPDYPLETLRKLIFPFLCWLPIVSMSLFFGSGIFKKLGIILLIPFLLMEIYRSFRMYKITKYPESFFTPIFDIITMLMYLVGMGMGIWEKGYPKV